LRLKGWRRLDKDGLAAKIEGAIRARGFGATSVVERASADPGASDTALALSMFLVPWRMLTELSANEREMWLVWTWATAAVGWQLRRHYPRTGEATAEVRSGPESGAQAPDLRLRQADLLKE
jgi:hypothetical protein